VECITFGFYCTTGWYFRPIRNNPYFRTDDDDEETGTFAVHTAHEEGRLTSRRGVLTDESDQDDVALLMRDLDQQRRAVSMNVIN
jgi:hypothetical protein